MLIREIVDPAVQALDKSKTAMHRPMRSYRHITDRTQEMLEEWLQRITTQPPDDSEVEVAIRSLNDAMELEAKQGGELVIA